jgi:hypothetical protein
MLQFLRIFLLNPNFLLAHRNRYLEGMDDGQKTTRGHPNFNSYVKNLRFWYSGRMDGLMDGCTDGDINPVWASLTTFLQVNRNLHRRQEAFGGDLGANLPACSPDSPP